MAGKNTFYFLTFVQFFNTDILDENACRFQVKDYPKTFSRAFCYFENGLFVCSTQHWFRTYLSVENQFWLVDKSKKCTCFVQCIVLLFLKNFHCNRLKKNSVTSDSFKIKKVSFNIQISILPNFKLFNNFALLPTTVKAKDYSSVP